MFMCSFFIRSIVRGYKIQLSTLNASCVARSVRTTVRHENRIDARYVVLCFSCVEHFEGEIDEFAKKEGRMLRTWSVTRKPHKRNNGNLRSDNMCLIFYDDKLYRPPSD